MPTFPYAQPVWHRATILLHFTPYTGPITHHHLLTWWVDTHLVSTWWWVIGPNNPPSSTHLVSTWWWVLVLCRTGDTSSFWCTAGFWHTFCVSIPLCPQLPTWVQRVQALEHSASGHYICAVFTGVLTKTEDSFVSAILYIAAYKLI